jgi:hypothetical protein
MRPAYQSERPDPGVAAASGSGVASPTPAAYPGSVYLLHASSRSNVAALPSVVHWLRQHGHRFGTVDELR